VLASPLIYSGQFSREDPELRLAHLPGHSELRFIYLCSSLILLYPDIEFSHNTHDYKAGMLAHIIFSSTYIMVTKETSVSFNFARGVTSVAGPGPH
jgi:hypothetical protein